MSWDNVVRIGVPVAALYALFRIEWKLGKIIDLLRQQQKPD
jgi:hypothetical protein